MIKINTLFTWQAKILAFIILLVAGTAQGQVHREWIAVNHGAAGSDNEAAAMVVDGQGNVYVTGHYDDLQGTNANYVTIKYNSSGEVEWINQYDGPVSGHDRAHDIAVDDSGNVYVTGKSEGGITERDFATIKYDATGVEQWVVRYNGPDNDNDDGQCKDSGVQSQG